jgi:hypothetical protein
MISTRIVGGQIQAQQTDRGEDLSGITRILERKKEKNSNDDRFGVQNRIDRAQPTQHTIQAERMEVERWTV